MNAALRVLLVEDNPTDEKLVAHALRKDGRSVEVHRVETRAALHQALVAGGWDVVLSDWRLPDLDGAKALALVRELVGDVPFILVSGTIGEETAADVVRAGAQDFVLKENLTRLVPAIDRELRERRERKVAAEALAASRAETEALENQLRQAQKMEAIGLLAGGVAHDFNNLLSVILSYTAICLQDLPPESPMRSDLDEVSRAAWRAAKLTQQLLLFSRQQVSEPRVLDLNAMVADMEGMVRRLVGEDVEVITQAEGSLGRVLMDPSHVEQIVLNLVVNARDAMPTGGVLTIETANVDLDAAFARLHLGVTPGPHVKLSVSDTGVGMDPTTLAQIFVPFFTTKPVGRGTGLGLSTVFGIIHRSGGTIWVSSELGRGTTFNAYLPRVDAGIKVRGPTAPASPKTVSAVTETVLLVEDEDALRAVALEILRKAGYRVLNARNAGEALLLCEKHTGDIDLMLSDVVMPYMSGPELAKRLLQVRPTMKLLFMSGYNDEVAVRHGHLEGGAAFVQKPITPDILTAKVRGVLDAP